MLGLDSVPFTSGSAPGERLLDFDVFFEREKAALFRALCLVTRNRFEAEELTLQRREQFQAGQSAADGGSSLHGSYRPCPRIVDDNTLIEVAA